ncbi:hypothetical protein [Streptomyces sp. NBC_00989]|uniref:hypothetical protein n=1 Tax=Streptomyces sp. NBC_00989 TaxID=2903705 RepID=UPI00386DF5FC|nr:hypothetical protein OG714_49890 [Streptomyces sp. NBC_00989]
MREFQPGDTAVWRDVFRRKVWSAHALRVVEDTAEALVPGRRPGAELLVPTTWIEWPRTGDETVRLRALPNLADDNRRLGHWTWRLLDLTERGVWEVALRTSLARPPTAHRRNGLGLVGTAPVS